MGKLLWTSKMTTKNNIKVEKKSMSFPIRLIQKHDFITLFYRLLLHVQHEILNYISSYFWIKVEVFMKYSQIRI